MTRTWMGVIALLFAVTAQAAQSNLKIVSFGSNQIKITPMTSSRFGEFSQIKVDGLATTRTLGAPELPVKTYLLQGRPEQITVALNVKKNEFLANVRPAPVQPEKCRCAVQQPKPFAFNQSQYEVEQAPYKLTYIGAFRGTPITRLDVPVASYDAQSNQVTLHTQMEVATNAADFSFTGGDYKDYLIIVPDALAPGISDFVAYKQAHGFNVQVEKVLSPANTLSTLQDTIKDHYKNGTDFVIIVGDEDTVPMGSVSTSGSDQTPTDLYDFTMDGPDDHVPDMFYSRIVATNADQVKAELAKSIEYESRTAGHAELGKIIGVASDQQGSGPADKDYVQSILTSFKTGLNVDSLFLYEDDSASNPTTLNNQLNQGAFWMTYVGHGSGYSWPSFNVEYSTDDWGQVNNKNVVKPVIIDVACMNGHIGTGYLGATAMSVNGNAAGAAAYLGGTVNISWDPPALMARGIASETMAKHFNYLGEAILAGQLYLSQNWTSEEDIVDNFEWYHLQGDPGMNIKF